MVPEDYPRLVGWLTDLLKLCRLPKKQKRLGFLTLHTDGQHTYWFRSTRNYITALNESLYSLETLADEKTLDSSAETNRVYRELSRGLETL